MRKRGTEREGDLDCIYLGIGFYVCVHVCVRLGRLGLIYIYIYMTLCAFMWEEKELREQ